MKTIKINAYQFDELSEDSKFNVKCWLDEYPIEYEHELPSGEYVMKHQYFTELDDVEASLHCELNNYLFTKKGKPIHHLKI